MIPEADRPQISGQASREEMAFAKTIVHQRAPYLEVGTEEYGRMLAMVVESMRAGEARGMTRRSVLSAPVSQPDDHKEVAHTAPVATPRPMSLRRKILTGAAVTALVGELGFIGYMMWGDDHKMREEGKSMGRDKIGTSFSEETPDGWQVAYMPRDPNRVFVPVGGEESVMTVNNYDLLRLSKTQADWLTDFTAFVKDNPYYAPYRRATGLGITKQNRIIGRTVYLREEPTETIDNSVLHFVNRRKGLDGYAALEPAFTGESYNGRTVAHLVVTPMRLR